MDPVRVERGVNERVTDVCRNCLFFEACYSTRCCTDGGCEHFAGVGDGAKYEAEEAEIEEYKNRFYEEWFRYLEYAEKE